MVRRGGGAVPGVRLEQRRPLRLHHRPDLGDPPGHPNRGCGPGSAVHALGARDVRRAGRGAPGGGRAGVLPRGVRLRVGGGRRERRARGCVSRRGGGSALHRCRH
ncbi:hypothetical protein MICRO11B_290083 [Micrococcus luteus]|nr:hypothetical protein MICRO11B_290083 [Micrococcus luteus]